MEKAPVVVLVIAVGLGRWRECKVVGNDEGNALGTQSDPRDKALSGRHKERLPTAIMGPATHAGDRTPCGAPSGQGSLGTLVPRALPWAGLELPRSGRNPIRATSKQALRVGLAGLLDAGILECASTRRSPNGAAGRDAVIRFEDAFRVE